MNNLGISNCKFILSISLLFTTFSLNANFDKKLFNYYGLTSSNYEFNDANEIQKVLSYFDEVIQLRPEVSHAYLERGFLHLLNKDVKSAISDFETSIQNRRELNDAYLYLAVAYSLEGKYEEAIEMFEEKKKEISSINEHNRFYCIFMLYIDDVMSGCEACEALEMVGGEIPNQLKYKCQ
jgi:tetratricopeptide (TPR) repeat protein